MADYEISVTALQTKKTSLDSLKEKVGKIDESYSSSSIKNAKDGYNNVSTKITTNIKRLTNGYNNSCDWFGNYLTELEQLESELASKKRAGLNEPIKFKYKFEDILGKITMPAIKTGGDPNCNANLVPNISKALADFLGPGVDDPSQYSVANNVKSMVKHMRMFDMTTGEEIPEDGHITLKKGETRIIIVKLPLNCGRVNEIHRTTAADTSNKGDYHGDTYQITTSRSNLTGDPNNIEYVNYQNGHWPSDKSILHNNTYQWIIHADKTGARQISQTCEFTTFDVPHWRAKAMIGLNITITD
jgi:hypothetical protein